MAIRTLSDKITSGNDLIVLLHDFLRLESLIFGRIIFKIAGTSLKPAFANFKLTLRFELWFSSGLVLNVGVGIKRGAVKMAFGEDLILRLVVSFGSGLMMFASELIVVFSGGDEGISTELDVVGLFELFRSASKVIILFV
jgi:hypothetical protein